MTIQTTTPKGSHADPFDTSAYAPTLGRKLVRAFQLGPKYYGFDLPRYLIHRYRLGLPLADWQALWNPARSFRKTPYVPLPLPPHYDDALTACSSVGVRFSMPRPRLEALLGVWWSTRGAQGDAIECGAYRGATSLLLGLLAKLEGMTQRVLVLDTFSGMPAPSQFDAYRSAGELAPPQGQVELIRKQAGALGILDRIDIHAGLFADTFARLRNQEPRFAFVHVDANIYQGTLEACEFTLPRIVSGGAVVFDDYNGLCDLGARLAIDASLQRRKMTPAPLAECSAYLVFP